MRNAVEKKQDIQTPTASNGQHSVASALPNNEYQSPLAETEKQTPIVKKQIGRNDPCPCGATKPDGTPVKYKNCHYPQYG